MPLCFPTACSQAPSNAALAGIAQLSALSQYETAASRSERRVGGKPVHNHATFSDIERKSREPSP